MAIAAARAVGKSELATSFANDHMVNFSLVWQLDAESETSLDAGYRELAEGLKMRTEKEDFETLRRKVHDKLERGTFEKPWLIILDNAEKSLPIPRRGGMVLATTRNGNLWRSANNKQQLEIKSFEKEEAISLFERLSEEKRSKEERKK